MDSDAVRLDHQLLTASEVADLLRLPVSTIYELARTGRLPYLRIGRAMRFYQQDLERTWRKRAAIRRLSAGPASADAIRRPARAPWIAKWYPTVVPGPVVARLPPSLESKNPASSRVFAESG